MVSRNNLHPNVRMVEEGAHVKWIDNFSKLYRVRMADSARPLLQDALWTGVAVRQFTGPERVDMSCLHYGGYFIPAMPPRPFSKRQEVLTLLDGMCTTAGKVNMMFEGQR